MRVNSFNCRNKIKENVNENENYVVIFRALISIVAKGKTIHCVIRYRHLNEIITYTIIKRF